MSGYVKSNIVGIGYYTAPDRFLNKSNNLNERELLYKNWWKEQINLYGIKIKYFVRDFDTSDSDTFYGERTIDGFRNGVDIVMAVVNNGNNIIFSKFGIMSDEDLDCFIDISTYVSSLSSVYSSEEDVEPKAGDVFQLIEFGSDRPGDRDGKFYEITERIHQDVNDINQLQGNYLYKIKSKRYDFTYTDDDVKENLSDMVIDDNTSGILQNAEGADTISPSPIEKLSQSGSQHANSVEEDKSKGTTDTDDNIEGDVEYGDRDDVYGGY